jgi:hypothetical protein
MKLMLNILLFFQSNSPLINFLKLLSSKDVKILIKIKIEHM